MTLSQSDSHFYFDTLLYYKRIYHVLLPFLIDANDRGTQYNKEILAHMVAFGFYEYHIHKHIQNEIYLIALNDILSSHTFDNIKIIRLCKFI